MNNQRIDISPIGGHGGLNFLPQKWWNVYPEKVRCDEEAAAKDKQLKRKQAHRRDSEFRLQQLHIARGLVPMKSPPPSEHINLFEGIRMFDPKQEEGDEPRTKKMKKEDVKILSTEDEKCRVGYSVVRKGVKVQWYLQKKKPPPVGQAATTTTTTIKYGRE